MAPGDVISYLYSLVTAPVDYIRKSRIIWVTSQGMTAEECRYADRLIRVLRDCLTMPICPPFTRVLDFLYLGSVDDALNVDGLRHLGISHVVNCALGDIKTGPHFYGDEIQYLGFEGEDKLGYNIMQHFDETYQFIEKARRSGGKVLIHCMAGVNRSGALAVAYVMCHDRIGPIAAARKVALVRKCILTNSNFQHQLIKLAAHNNILILDKAELDISG